MFPLINFDVPSKRAKGGFFLYPHKQHGLTRLVGRPRKRAEYVHMQEAVGAGEGGGNDTRENGTIFHGTASRRCNRKNFTVKNLTRPGRNCSFTVLIETLRYITLDLQSALVSRWRAGR